MQAFVAHPRMGKVNAVHLDSIYQLRYRAFRERLNWEVATVNERERDHYDDQHPVYVMVRDAQQVLACARLLPTTGPYMLQDTFPQLLTGRSAPVDDAIWEISRFAVTNGARAGLGFTTLPAALIRQIICFAVLNGIREYVFVTTVAFERLLVRMGVHLERFGPPQQIGIEKSVALRVFMDEQTIHATRADCEIDPFLGAPTAEDLLDREPTAGTYQYY
ncbi:MAG: acyl-homoserine-lactone synthase [Pseudomonadota bacterium]|nr:acyl-homoserine-lactone synthase [Pseudomonadota bacterium]